MRFALLRLAGDQHCLVVTNHHLLMDGWSLPVLVRELLTLYARHGDSGALARVTPYRNYLAWLAVQDRSAASAAWGEALAGLAEPTRVAPLDRARAPVVPAQLTFAASEMLTAALTGQGRRHGVTLNSFIQAVWAIVLALSDWARRRGVRRYGGGTAAGDTRHRDHGGAVHQHASAARQA